MNWSRIGYAVVCVVAPMAWGLLVVGLSNFIERRVRHQKPDTGAEEPPPIEYHI